MDTWLRVLVYVVLAIAPTALFLGLWNGLNRLRDDELAQRALEQADSSPARSTFAGRLFFSHADQHRRVNLDDLPSDGSSPSGGRPRESTDAPVAPTGADARAAPTGTEADEDADQLREPVVCEACGAPNDPEFDRCAECLTDL